MAFEDLQNRSTGTRPQAITTDALFDAGLRQHMVGIFNYMFLGLALSGGVALLLMQSGATSLFFSGPGQFTMLGWIAVFAPLGILLLASFSAARLNTGATHAVYWSVAALQGVSLAVLFQTFTGQSIAQVFFVTAAAFGALSLYGYTTKRSLSGMGAFLIIGLVGVVIASVVNMFLQSSLLHFVASVIGVLVFAGLTAFDTQRLKNEYIAGVSGDVAMKAQVWGALSLYLNFINLFQLLLSLFGQREE
jgi:FtsH-binding integral membrane protein